MYKFKNSSFEGSEEREKHGRETVYYFRENISFHEQIVGGNTGV